MVGDFTIAIAQKNLMHFENNWKPFENYLAITEWRLNVSDLNKTRKL